MKYQLLSCGNLKADSIPSHKGTTQSYDLPILDNDHDNDEFIESFYKCVSSEENVPFFECISCKENIPAVTKEDVVPPHKRQKRSSRPSRCGS